MPESFSTVALHLSNLDNALKAIELDEEVPRIFHQISSTFVLAERNCVCAGCLSSASVYHSHLIYIYIYISNVKTQSLRK